MGMTYIEDIDFECFVEVKSLTFNSRYCWLSGDGRGYFFSDPQRLYGIHKRIGKYENGEKGWRIKGGHIPPKDTRVIRILEQAVTLTDEEIWE